MMAPTQGRTPNRWAIDGTQLLRAFQGEVRFPVDIETLATNWSAHLEPDRCDHTHTARPLEKVPEGALVDARRKGNGWGIAFADTIATPGRVRFTIAHEFGRFLMHRDEAPDGGFQCSQGDMGNWDYENSRQEAEANRFAARILMPLDDFRTQIPAQEAVTLEDIGRLTADRYGVSLMAAVLQWLDYTRRRVVFVCSRDGYILWARSSEPASSPVPSSARALHRLSPFRSTSPASGARMDLNVRKGLRHRAGIWFDEPVREEVILSDQFEIGLSLLHLEDSVSARYQVEPNEPDALDFMRMR